MKPLTATELKELRLKLIELLIDKKRGKNVDKELLDIKTTIINSLDIIYR
jgi:hypothetical protein